MSTNEYKEFVASTGYGTGGGLCGWNCRHTFIPFNPETMSNNLKKYKLEENEEMYKKHQEQRYIERNIRKYKRIVQTYKTSIEKTSGTQEAKLIKQKYIHYKQLVNKWEKRYKEYNLKNNLRAQMDRTKV